MIITKVVFEKEYEGEYGWLPISDIPQEFLVPENKIMINVHSSYHDSNGWSDGETIIRIAVEREQTPEEKEEMKKFIREKQAERRKERYEGYLKLKAEFEPNE
jgi:hypothetical protein